MTSLPCTSAVEQRPRGVSGCGLIPHPAVAAMAHRHHRAAPDRPPRSRTRQHSVAALPARLEFACAIMQTRMRNNAEMMVVTEDHPEAQHGRSACQTRMQGANSDGCRPANQRPECKPMTRPPAPASRPCSDVPLHTFSLFHIERKPMARSPARPHQPPVLRRSVARPRARPQQPSLYRYSALAYTAPIQRPCMLQNRERVCVWFILHAGTVQHHSVAVWVCVCF